MVTLHRTCNVKYKMVDMKIKKAVVNFDVGFGSHDIVRM